MPKIASWTFANDDVEEDKHIKALLQQVSASLTNSCPSSTDDPLFPPNTKAVVIEEFKDHFRNVTRIMNCVSCERCRLWGKIQTTGIGTALKVLFLSEDRFKWDSAQFRRSEIIALFNTFGRISESIIAVKKFRKYHHDLAEKEMSFLVFADLAKYFYSPSILVIFTLLLTFFISITLLRRINRLYS